MNYFRLGKFIDNMNNQEGDIDKIQLIKNRICKRGLKILNKASRKLSY
jgi:hypothetical protein